MPTGAAIGQAPTIPLAHPCHLSTRSGGACWRALVCQPRWKSKEFSVRDCAEIAEDGRVGPPHEAGEDKDKTCRPPSCTVWLSSASSLGNATLMRTLSFTLPRYLCQTVLLRSLFPSAHRPYKAPLHRASCPALLSILNSNSLVVQLKLVPR